MAGIRNRQKIDLGIVLVINLIFYSFVCFFATYFMKQMTIMRWHFLWKAHMVDVPVIWFLKT